MMTRDTGMRGGGVTGVAGMIRMARVNGTIVMTAIIRIAGLTGMTRMIGMT